MDEKNTGKPKDLSEVPEVEVIKKERDKFHHGENIKFFRKKKKWKQDYLASLLGVSQQTISEWESKEALSEEILKKMGDALEIGISWIKENPFYENGGDGVINQYGSNPAAFSNNESVSYSVTNPLGEVKEAYKDSLDFMTKSLEIVSQNSEKMQNVYETSLKRHETKNKSIINDLRSKNRTLEKENKELRMELNNIYFTKLKE